jgi:Ca-activated chloride channel homolog
MFQFENTYMFWLLLLVPILFIQFLYFRKKVKSRLNVFAENKFFETLVPNLSKIKFSLKFILLLIAFVSLIFALANPQTSSKLEEVKREGIDLVICLDVSNSMRAEDLQPNRLWYAKQTIERLINKMENDRIGIVIFAGEAFTQLPVTTDYSAARIFLNDISFNSIPTQGTAIGAAIELAINSFDKKSPTKKEIIVITDGENHEDNAVKQAELASELNIGVNTIGLGSTAGVPIPEYNAQGNNVGFKKDNNGTTVITKLNEQALSEIALAGKGIYVHDNNNSYALNTLFEKLNTIEKKSYATKVFTDFDTHYEIFAIAALFLMILEQLITYKRSTWWDNLNLFGNRKNNLKNE